MSIEGTVNDGAHMAAAMGGTYHRHGSEAASSQTTQEKHLSCHLPVFQLFISLKRKENQNVKYEFISPATKKWRQLLAARLSSKLSL